MAPPEIGHGGVLPCPPGAPQHAGQVRGVVAAEMVVDVALRPVHVEPRHYYYYYYYYYCYYCCCCCCCCCCYYYYYYYYYRTSVVARAGRQRLSNATCLMRPRLFYARFVVSGIIIICRIFRHF